MKNMIFATILLLLAACNGSTDSNSKAATAPAVDQSMSMDWLLGQWQRTNNAENQSTYEVWSKDAFGDYVGHGVTMQGQDTVFQEMMEIVEWEGALNLKVIVTGGESPTNFKFTKQTPTSFICENPENDFPKLIQYKRNGKNLEARISSGEQIVDFFFVSKKQ